MKIKEEHMIDFLIGFLFVPFLVFIIKTSIMLISSPESISDGMAIIYIALITGLYYIFNKKSSIIFMEKPKFNIAKTLGILTFVIIKLLLANN